MVRRQGAGILMLPLSLHVLACPLSNVKRIEARVKGVGGWSSAILVCKYMEL